MSIARTIAAAAAVAASSAHAVTVGDEYWVETYGTPRTERAWTRCDLGLEQPVDIYVSLRGRLRAYIGEDVVLEEWMDIAGPLAVSPNIQRDIVAASVECVGDTIVARGQDTARIDVIDLVGGEVTTPRPTGPPWHAVGAVGRNWTWDPELAGGPFPYRYYIKYELGCAFQTCSIEGYVTPAPNAGEGLVCGLSSCTFFYPESVPDGTEFRSMYTVCPASLVGAPVLDQCATWEW